MKKNGFTLLEMILVFGILVIILPLGFSIFFASSRAQVKVFVLQDVKRNGDTAFTIMENLIKTQAISLEDADGEAVCDTAPSSYTAGDVYFVDKDQSRFRFYVTQDRIASESSSIGTSLLTSDKAKIDTNSFVLTCQRESTFSPPLITLSYTISQISDTQRAEEKATLDYLTKIRLRSY